MKISSGAPFLFVAAFIFSLTGIFNRLAGEEFGPGMMLFVSASSAAGVFGVVILIKRQWKRILRSDIKLFVTRGILLALDFPAFFIAVNHIELGLALLAYNASSIITNFMYGRFGLGEKISRIELVSLALALLGLIVVNIDNLGTVKLFYVVPAMISGMSFSLNGVTSKKISSIYPEAQVNMLTYGMGALLSPIVIFTMVIAGVETISVTSNIQPWLGGIGFGVLASTAFFLVIYGFKRIDVQKGGLILLSELIFTFVIGWIVYHEGLIWNDWLGAGLILTALSLPNLSARKKA